MLHGIDAERIAKARSQRAEEKQRGRSTDLKSHKPGKPPGQGVAEFGHRSLSVLSSRNSSACEKMPRDETTARPTLEKAPTCPGQAHRRPAHAGAFQSQIALLLRLVLVRVGADYLAVRPGSDGHPGSGGLGC